MVNRTQFLSLKNINVVDVQSNLNKEIDNMNYNNDEEVDGVFAMAGGITPDMVTKTSMKKLAKSVHVEVNEMQVSISLKLVIKMNENIIKISKKVQDKVKQTVENMTCLDVVNVDVNIASVGE